MVTTAWCGKNFAATLSDNVPGAVVFTARTFPELRKEAKETLDFHVEGMKERGEDLPQWLAEGDYELVFHYADMATMLHAFEPYVTLAAISRASGINQALLSHYASGIKKPRPQQRRRIIDGLHKIGSELQAANC